MADELAKMSVHNWIFHLEDEFPDEIVELTFALAWKIEVAHNGVLVIFKLLLDM